jgi:hypothetical protein
MLHCFLLAFQHAQFLTCSERVAICQRARKAKRDGQDQESEEIVEHSDEEKH